MLEDYIMLLDQLNCAYYPSFNPLLYPFSGNLNKENFVKRILIIDDDKEISELLKSKLLEDRRIKVFTAEDPFEAMEILNHQVVDAIILDWILPEMTGAETLSKTEQVFKTDPNLPYEWEDKKVKVIVLSGRERTECKASSTKHFRYAGYVSKKTGNLETILENILKYIHKIEI
jgi:CheY-like chemotaxis protein